MSRRMLEGYRALDLTDKEAQLCGRILADLGVDVIRIEKPGGDSSRQTGPFYQDEINPEKNLWWYVLNANKRGITLNLECQDGRDIFKKLVKNADFVIESHPPGYMSKLGLGYTALSEINPKIIMTSLTPFGQTGPYKDFKDTELVLMAMGVFMNAIGDADRPPTKPNYPLACIASAIHASSAILLAHYHCTKSGHGQYIDVSAQAGGPWFTGNLGVWWQTDRRVMARNGGFLRKRPDLNVRFVWPCKDGYVLFQVLNGVMGTRSNKAIAQWMAEEEASDEHFKNVDWDNLDIYQEPQEVTDKLEKPVGAFFLTKTKQELVEEATKRGFLLGYISKVEELLQNAQLESHQYWKEIEHPELEKSLTYSGYFVKSSLLDCSITQRAPLIGEHNNEIYSEIGISHEQLLSLNQAGVI